MKKLFVGVLIIMMSTLNGCNNNHENNENKYQNKINQVLKIQEETHKVMVEKSDEVNKNFNKEKVNRYVFQNGKLIIISYPLYKNKSQLFYATYEFKGDKIFYKRDFNPKKYIREHKADYKEEKYK